MILLDTHVLMWSAENDPRLGRLARVSLQDGEANAELAVSAITFWEIAQLAQRGRIQILESASAWRRRLLASRLIELPLDGAVAIASVELGGLHKDPADRFIAATALAHDATLVTADEKLLAWQAPVVRIDARR